MESLHSEALSWLLALLSSVLVFLLKMAVDVLRNMSDSVAELNQKMAQMLERVSFHQRILDDYGVRISRIEDEVQ